jgi:hypothetical protein
MAPQPVLSWSCNQRPVDGSLAVTAWNLLSNSTGASMPMIERNLWRLEKTSMYSNSAARAGRTGQLGVAVDEFSFGSSRSLSAAALSCVHVTTRRPTGGPFPHA